MTITIAPLDDDAKRQLLKAVADRGYANGLDAAAEILTALVNGRMRVVDTSEIKKITAALQSKAAHLRANASGAIATLEART